jgi:nucleoside-diphosphate-sugar epimerase
MARIFLVGAGYVGSLAAELLRRAGHEVHVGRRHPEPSAHSHAMDVLQPQTFPDALRESDCVVYTVSADNFTPEAYREAYVEGLSRVIGALGGTKARRVVFVSSTGVYAQDDASVVDESSPAEPRGFSGKMLLEGEGLLAAAPFEAAVLRLSGIYGPGRDRLVREVLAQTPVSAKSRAAITNRIHREDCARAIVHLVERPAVQRLYVGSDEAPTPMGEILDWLAGQLGVPPPPVGEANLHTQQRGGNKRCSSARLRGEGFVFRHPTYRQGFTAILAGRRQESAPPPTGD